MTGQSANSVTTAAEYHDRSHPRSIAFEQIPFCHIQKYLGLLGRTAPCFYSALVETTPVKHERRTQSAEDMARYLDR
jgi:hypothetical protein